MIEKIKGALLRIVRVTRIVKPNVIYYYCMGKITNMNTVANIIEVEMIKKGIDKDTIFILGSGYSINDITKEEWKKMEVVGDTLSFNYFFLGEFISITYHICGEITTNYGILFMMNKRKKAIKSYYNKIFRNLYYKNTTFFLRYRIDHSLVPIAMWALLHFKAFKNKQVCLYGINRYINKILNPSDDINAISHHSATLFDAINIAYLLGYKKIVLVGVDLYDQRYFWLKENETSEEHLKEGSSCNDVHGTADIVLRAMSIWKEYLEKKGIALYIYNPHSLLNDILPLYKFDEGDMSG